MEAITIPKPQSGESQDQFIARCVPIVLHEGTAADGSQAAAICHSIWRESKKEIDELATENVTFDQWVKQAVPILMRGGQGEQAAMKLCKVMWEEKQMPNLTNLEFCKKLIGDPSCFNMLGNKEFFYDSKHSVPVLAEYTPSDIKFLRIKRLSPQEIEEKAEGKKKKKIIRGFAATTDLDRDDEKFALSALSDAKDQLLKAGSSTVFFNHDWHDWPIGKVVATDIAQTDNNQSGLWVEIELANNEDGDKIFDLVKQEILKSFSVSFRPQETESVKDEEGKTIERTFNKADFFEVSVVGIPANPHAVIGDFFLKSLLKSFGPERQMATTKDSIRFVEKSVLSNKNQEKTMTPEDRKEIAAIVMEAIVAREEQQKKLEDERKRLREEIRAELKALDLESKMEPMMDEKHDDWIKRCMGSGKDKDACQMIWDKKTPSGIPTVVVPKEMTDSVEALKKQMTELVEKVGAIKVVQERKGGDKATDVPAAGGNQVTFEEIIKRDNTDVEKAIALMTGYETDPRCKKLVDEIKKSDPAGYDELKSNYLRNYLGNQSIVHQARQIAKVLVREGQGDEGEEETDDDSKES
mgnify:CR=1 FL=1